jgi:hypothetical protein
MALGGKEVEERRAFLDLYSKAHSMTGRELFSKASETVLEDRVEKYAELLQNAKDNYTGRAADLADIGHYAFSHELAKLMLKHNHG